MVKPLWSPNKDIIENSALNQFKNKIEKEFDLKFQHYNDLHRFSVERREDFWSSFWDFANIIGEKGENILEKSSEMWKEKFFPEAHLNFTENILKKVDNSEAIVFWGEDKVHKKLSSIELKKDVLSLSKTLTAFGVESGDRVAAFLPNMPETVVSCLATAKIGAVWSSCSPDFGVQGVLDRFGQINPKILIAVDGYHYNGKEHSSLGKLKEIITQLPSVEKVIIVPYLTPNPDLRDIQQSCLWNGCLDKNIDIEAVEYKRFPFNHPLFIMFSSGTTGKPKCIVHGAGGTLLQHIKEHQLHCDIKPKDRVFYFTTCGWMMWNWLVTALASQATLLLYDGAPTYRNGNILFDFAEKEKMTLFGTSAKFIDAIKKMKLSPKASHDLKYLKTLTSTGSPLVKEGFEYIYKHIKSDIHLASISGGTDIISCFVLGAPTLPVWAGEIQSAGLGMDVSVCDLDGEVILEGKGELICKKSFPSMPIYFWDDNNGQKYKSAYFERFKNIWCHGDFIERTSHGGFIIHGRSDATLNPGGVRIGTAEIYRQVEKLDEVLESIAVGQDWQGDVRVILFVKLADEITLDQNLIDQIKVLIRENTTPRHVPAKVLAIQDIPRTKSGKMTEMAVRDIIHGRGVKNKEALANPESLDYYKNLPELKT